MNSTTVATVVAAGLAMATLAAGGIALWLYRRSKLEAPPAPQPQRPTNPEPRRSAPPMSDETPSWFRDPFAEDEAAAPAPEPPRAAESPPTEARGPAPPKSSTPTREAWSGPQQTLWPYDEERLAANQAELDAKIEQQLRATEIRPTAKPRTSPPAAAPTSRAVEPTNRKRRYSVQPGQLIEVEIGDAPPGTVWRSSRDDVHVRVIEQRGDRLRFTLHGRSGDVNVGLVQDGVKRAKAVRSWKFELCDAA